MMQSHPYYLSCIKIPTFQQKKILFESTENFKSKRCNKCGRTMERIMHLNANAIKIITRLPMKEITSLKYCKVWERRSLWNKEEDQMIDITRVQVCITHWVQKKKEWTYQQHYQAYKRHRIDQHLRLRIWELKGWLILRILKLRARLTSIKNSKFLFLTRLRKDKNRNWEKNK